MEAKKNETPPAGDQRGQGENNNLNQLSEKPGGLSGEKSTDDTVPEIPQKAAPQAELTVITSEKPKILSKRLSIDSQGQLKKNAAAEMTEGRADRVSVSSLDDFAAILNRLEKNQALAYGVTAYDSISLVTKQAYYQQGRPADRIPRSKEFFTYPNGPAILMVDYDPEATGNIYDRESLVSALRGAVPGLENVSFLWMPSSSSHIHNNGTELVGLKGQRLYMLVASGTDIPRSAQAITEYLWAAGYGYFKVGVAGQMLERCLVDATVYQPNRLDFAAGAVCASPLHQERGEPVLIPGEIEFLDTASAIPEPGADIIATAKANREKARAAVQDEAKEQRENYIATKAVELAGPNADDEAIKKAKQTVRRAIKQKTLHGDFPVFVRENGQTKQATVGDILDDPARYHGLQTLDPIEPDYDGSRAVGKLFLYGSRPNLYSFARGGRVFKLSRQPARIELARGKTREATLQTLELMRKQPDLFDLGSAPVVVENGRIYPLDEHALKHEISGRAQYFTTKKNKGGEWIEVLEDPPTKVVKSIIALGERRGLKTLDAAVDMPLIRPDGSVLHKPGYDEKTRILLDISEPALINHNPTVAECDEALVRLMYPFSGFPFCGPVDKGVLLAAIFTAIARPGLDMAPAIGVDAPVQGSGKTLLARCLSILSTGDAPSVWPHTSAKEDEEIRKRIFSALREGSRAILWDNVLGVLSSASLAAVLTSPVFQDRILGKSESQRVPNKALFIITGNNICLAGDLPRRVFIIRIDPGVEKPFSRQFDMDPAAYCLENRRQMVIDAITIMRGAFIHHSRPVDDVGFTAWNELIRRAVLFAGDKLSPGQFADPKNTMDDAQNADPEQEVLYAFLSAWWDSFGNKKITASELIFPANPNLVGAVSDLMGGNPLTTRGLGRVLRFKKDRIVGGLVLKEAASIKKMAKNWYVTNGVQ